jgi:hypothetical protein
LAAYAHATLWLLQKKIAPRTYRDLEAVHAQVVAGRGG